MFSRINSRTVSLSTWIEGGALLVGIYAVLGSNWKLPSAFWILAMLLVMVESFPFQLGKVSFTFSFPLIYVMGIVADFEATALISALIIFLVCYGKKYSFRIMKFNAACRVLSIVGTGISFDWIQSFHFYKGTLISYLVGLVGSTLSYTLLSIIVIWLFLFPPLVGQRYLRTLLKLGFLNFFVSFLYDGFMLWLAMNPKNTGSGNLGTLFYFLPLVASAVVIHLFSNLSRAKAGLETLFTISKSINQQQDYRSLLKQVVVEASELNPLCVSQIYMRQDEDTLLLAASTQIPCPQLQLPIQAGIVGHVTRSGVPLLIQDVFSEPSIDSREIPQGSRSMLAVPICIEEKVVAVLTLSKQEPDGFQPENQKMMTIFASHIAVAIKNALYIEEREKRLVLEERNRLARDIHDGIAQELASLLFQIEMCKRGSHKERDLRLDDLQTFIRNLSNSVRSSIHNLRPAPFTHIGFIPAIYAHLSEVQAQTNMKTHFNVDFHQEQLPICLASTIFQILSECTQNSIKHANAQNIWVTLKGDSQCLTVTIQDDGKGFEFGKAILQAVEKNSFGIENLYQAADEIGATLDFHTAVGQGTMVTLQIPLEEGTKHEDSRFAL